MHEHNTPPCLLPQLNKFLCGNESTLAKASRKKMSKTSSKKRNFTESELEVLLSEVETRKNILFGTLSSGINNKRKKNEWDSLADAVNAVGSENRTVNELKKKWSDIKVEVKRRTAAHRQSVGRTGSGTGVDELTPFEQRVASIVGDTLLSGVVSVAVGDSDLQDCHEGTSTGTHSESAPPEQPGPSMSSVSSVFSVPPSAEARPSGRVLTHAVLESQQQIVRAIGEINSHLKNITDALTDISHSLKELVKK
ncbi:nuclear apoptosis-inducing factor 1-like isoform X2 [Sinocyclocheilus anshuiensis]|uniref:nuclear apoptosis-inducing factor 1-like isoform X2 n=1 Tax=Sinocyclocheilus anshuiensis TaxID=1608454 RepID=UPI0007B9444A|nr:PREDICTED: nuclear apoptosis-inducing factor 1-like isoform X2 [Sinocyclocheilus anshuiensis]